MGNKLISTKRNSPLCFVAAFLGLLGSVKAATLVNDFSNNNPIRGYNWTDPTDPTRTDGITSNYSTNFNASTSAVAGLVDQGFVTVDYQSPFPPSTFYSYAVDAYSNFGGPVFDLSGVTGFLVSLRKEASNTAMNINFYIIDSADAVYSWQIATSSLSATEFRVVPITLADNPAWVTDSPSAAWNIGVAASNSNPASARYNISIDSVSYVPEPSSGFLLVSGLGALAILRRRFR